MKGITPVIAIILLLLITISMVGFAFVWFTRVSELATEQTQNQMQKDLDRQSQKIRIDAAAGAAVTIRNIGTKSIPKPQIAVFVDNNAKTCDAAWTGDLAAGVVATCTYTGTACTSGTSVVKVTAPGNSDSVKCA